MAKNPLNGRFFHVLVKDRIELQGRVVGLVAKDQFLIEFFSFIDGRTTKSFVVHAHCFIEGAAWKAGIRGAFAFYSDREQMVAAWEAQCRADAAAVRH